MPLYDYRCKSCGHIFEVLQKMNEPSVLSCLECGHESERLISGGGFVFKGSGFYITDNKKSSTPQTKSES
ncbi:MAG: zinc ribbon domain-containing protein [Bacteroidetes bacterium]|nr:zinc ribbon domain-containing protein [Bacteroidota bacterium]